MAAQGNYYHTFYFQAFSEEFALVSDDVEQLVNEGTTLLSHAKVDTGAELSAKVQDVRERFLRLRDLVKQEENQRQRNGFERFEDTARDYKRKFDAVNTIIRSQLQWERVGHESSHDSKVRAVRGVR